MIRKSVSILCPIDFEVLTMASVPRAVPACQAAEPDDCLSDVRGVQLCVSPRSSHSLLSAQEVIIAKRLSTNRGIPSALATPFVRHIPF